MMDSKWKAATFMMFGLKTLLCANHLQVHNY